MPGDDLKKVQRGQTLRIPASAYNAFIDAAADTGNDAVQNLQQVLVVAEGDVRADDAALLFHKDVLGAVDHDVGDPFFLHQDFEGAEAEGFIQHLVDEAFALLRGVQGARRRHRTR